MTKKKKKTHLKMQRNSNEQKNGINKKIKKNEKHAYCIDHETFSNPFRMLRKEFVVY